ncbi:16S rRNA (uracil(1498)-N(3))-methyltransferase [Neobittarella massiliensis]|uniref:Ribosomal RNA small subunit methyltransferase E n=1 Tax=Neobittarella massiliensis (ex Bilen et al. 2018) TaxID=2041842 RepID=A0A8J6ILG3_9FIRM|nr:16S rRNA (uracil(1498)-N(3))-methyltransferase [Neobittarella massiliensis]MBC3516791.1 16S rRNA (uracil(1498)-N(3))-methyltransferase [Neobittarella massiliensis]
MPKFFTSQIDADAGVITGPDVRHIARVLRHQPGDELLVCDGQGRDYRCRIAAIEEDRVLLAVLASAPCPAEPSVELTVYQALPKADKMSLIVQKCVELGAAAVVPVTTHRCVSRPDAKGMRGKVEKWQKTADEAAKQCGRGVLPRVGDCLSLTAALQQMAGDDLAVLFYEKGGQPLTQLVGCKSPRRISILVGCEGGFEEAEVAAATAAGVQIATLGSRILRCETAPIAACAVLMHLTGNL